MSCNFAKAAGGEPTLLSFDEARTLFHEFGHALHGLLSDVTYPTISGTSVATRFRRISLAALRALAATARSARRFARHFETGEPMPEELLRRCIAARNFNQGFATVEYRRLGDRRSRFPFAADAGDDRRRPRSRRHALDRIGMPAEIAMRHRPPHFDHVFSGGGYAAGYYSYMWSEVLDADAFEAFEETGDIFDPATAKRLHDTIYAAGGARDPADAYKAFRGRLPSAEALLRKRGLSDTRRGEHKWSWICTAPVIAAASSARRITAAVEAGRAILAEGGNAIEAMLAMAATIAAVYPHMNHIGGDGFWLIREPSGRVRAIMAPGPPASRPGPNSTATRKRFRPADLSAALTVPGAVGGWMLALDAAKAQWRKDCRPICCSTSAIAHARDGYRVTREPGTADKDKLAELAAVPGFAETFLVDGKPPAAGTPLKQDGVRRNTLAARACRP